MSCKWIKQFTYGSCPSIEYREYVVEWCANGITTYMVVTYKTINADRKTYSWTTDFVTFTDIEPAWWVASSCGGNISLPSSRTAFAANYNNWAVTVIDTNTNLVTETFWSFSQPRANEINPFNGILYTGEYWLAQVSLTDTTNPSYPTIAVLPVGSQPRSIETRPDWLEVWVSNNGSNSISVIDSDPASITNNTVISTITGINSNPRWIKFDNTWAFAYVTCIGWWSVYKIDTTTKVATLLTVLWDSPHGIEVSNDGSKIYSSGFSSGILYIRDTTTWAIIANIPMNWPHGMAKKNGKIYVGNYYAGTVSVVDQNTDTITATIPGVANPYSLDEDPSAEQVYVSSDSASIIYVIDTISDTVVRTIPIQTRSRHITVS